jgi:hypothetical protein
VAEAKTNEKVFKAKVPTPLRFSYSSYYRQMLPPLLNTLGFKCNNTVYQPVMDAMKLLQKYADVDGKTRFYDAGEEVPMGGVVREDWREAVVDDKGRVERIPYELCVLVALRDAVRRREIYVEGAARWHNPEDDLPGGFEATRAVHYAAICQPMNPGAFIADLKKRMTAGLDQLSGALGDGSAGGVKVTTRKDEPWITVPKLEPLAEPTAWRRSRRRSYAAPVRHRFHGARRDVRLYTARAQLRPLLSGSSFRRRLTHETTTEVENFPNFPEGIDGPLLMENMRAQAEMIGHDIVAVDLSTDSAGTIHRAKTVIIETGSGYRKLSSSDEDELSGHPAPRYSRSEGSFDRAVVPGSAATVSS